MNKLGLVSIIIPTYNRAALIAETLDSIIRQTYDNWECIIVDDGSSDDTEALVGKYQLRDKRIKYANRPSTLKKGANACRNYGLSLSEGEYVNWFDSDDLMLPKKLELQVDMLKSSDLPFVVCQTLVFEGHQENILGLRKKDIYSKDFFNDFITNKIKWLTQAPLFKKEFLDKTGLRFDENLTQSQERDFFIKVLAKVENYLFDDTPLVLFRKHENSISYGKTAIHKLKSNFNVDYRVLTNYENKLSAFAIKTLKRSLKSQIKKAVRAGDNDLVKIFRDAIQAKQAKFSCLEKLKLDVGIVSIKSTNRGDIFFK